MNLLVYINDYPYVQIDIDGRVYLEVHMLPLSRFDHVLATKVNKTTLVQRLFRHQPESSLWFVGVNLFQWRLFQETDIQRCISVEYLFLPCVLW